MWSLNDIYFDRLSLGVYSKIKIFKISKFSDNNSSVNITYMCSPYPNSSRINALPRYTI